MKRSFIVVGGTKPQEPETKKIFSLDNLKDTEINKLYKKLITMDGKHKAFKGTKRQYCETIMPMILKFNDGVSTVSKTAMSLSGSGKGKMLKAKDTRKYDEIMEAYNKAQAELHKKHALLSEAYKKSSSDVKKTKENYIEYDSDSDEAKELYKVLRALKNRKKQIRTQINDYASESKRLYNDKRKAFNDELGITAAAEGKEAEALSSLVADMEADVRERRGTRDEMRDIIKENYPKLKDNFNEAALKGTLPVHGAHGRYYEEAEEEVENPFIYGLRQKKTISRAAPREPRTEFWTYDLMLDEAVKYSKYIEYLTKDGDLTTSLELFKSGKGLIFLLHYLLHI